MGVEQVHQQRRRADRPGDLCMRPDHRRAHGDHVRPGIRPSPPTRSPLTSRREYGFEYSTSAGLGAASIFVLIFGYIVVMVVGAAIQSAYTSGLLDIANGQACDDRVVLQAAQRRWRHRRRPDHRHSWPGSARLCFIGGSRGGVLHDVHDRRPARPQPCADRRDQGKLQSCQGQLRALCCSRCWSCMRVVLVGALLCGVGLLGRHPGGRHSSRSTPTVASPAARSRR